MRGYWLGIVLILATAATPVAAQTTEIVFVNRTGSTLYFLYVSPTTADSWGDDVLGRTILPDGQRFTARLRPSPSYDIRAIDSDGNEYISWGWNSSAGEFVVEPESNLGIRSAAQGESDAVAWLGIRNETNYPVVQIVASPAGTGTWETGQRFLESGDELRHGEQMRIEVETDGSDNLLFDIMLVDADGDRYVKREVNLSISGQLIYTLDDIRF